MTLKTTCLVTLLITAELRGDVKSVCEAIENRLELSGKTVKIRGSWGWGDANSDLQAVTACDRRTVVDGWLFSDTIDVVADKGDFSVGGYVAKQIGLQKKHGNVKVIATLSGRLEARAHFEIFADAFGLEIPRAYDGSVARLRFWRADDFQVIPYAPGELERELERERRPMPKRVITK